MAGPPFTNSVVSIWRMVYNATSKQSVLTQMATNMAVYIAEVRRTHLEVQAGIPEFTLEFLVAGSVDIRDGDQLRGYNPQGAAIPPILNVEHVDPTTPPPVSVKSGRLTALKPAGSST